MYCPHCDHCNNIKDDTLKTLLNASIESKLMINKGLEIFLSETQKINHNVDIFSDLFKAFEGGINNLLLSFPKTTNSQSRLTYDILINFLNTLLDDKIDIDNIISEDLKNKFDNSLLSKGLIHEYNNIDLIFDKEISDFFDDSAKRSLIKIYKKELQKNKENALLSSLSLIQGNTKVQVQRRKKFLVYFLILIFMLSETSKEFIK